MSARASLSDAEAIRRDLAEVSDPAGLLAGLFARAPMAAQIYRADGTSLLVNEAFRALFGAEAPPGPCVLEGEAAGGASPGGVSALIRRAFEGETVHLPVTWCDPRAPRAPGDFLPAPATERRQVAIEVTFFPLRDAAGVVTHVASIYKDRTDELLAERRAAELLERERLARADAETQRERLYAVFEQAPAAIAILRGPEFVYDLSNWKNQEFAHGRQLVGKTVREALPELEAQGFFQKLEDVYQTGVPLVHPEVQVHVAMPGGGVSERFLSGVYHPLRDAAGQVEGVMAFAYEVTELVEARRRAEALARARSESEARFRRLYESGVIGVVFWTRAGELVDANEAFLQMVGYTREEMQAGLVRWRAMTPPEFASVDEHAFAEMDERGFCTPYEKEYFHRDGHRVPIQLGVAFWEGSRTEGVAWILDITARTRAAERERLLVDAGRILSSSLEVEATLSGLVRLVVDRWATLATVDLMGEDGQIGAKFTVAHRDPGAEALVQRIRERYPPWPSHPVAVAARTGASRLVREVPAMAGEILQDTEHRAMMDALAVRSAIVVPLASRGRVLGVLSFCTADRSYDEADLATAEELGRRAGSAIDGAQLFAMAQEERRRAEEASRAKDEFLAVVSHELRTPLHAMLGWTRMLRMGTLGPEKQARALETVERNAQAQAQLVEDLLDVSRIITGKLRINVGPVQLAPVVEAAIDAVRPAAEAKGVHLEPELDGRAPLVAGDPDRLQQVIWNLLSNAVRFTPRGGRVRVRLHLREADGEADGAAEISVADTGEGIPADFLPFVFDRFRQADAGTTRQHGGLGLGLSIVRHLVELHGGTVSVDSPGPGQGATFVVRIPARPSSG